MGHLFHILTGEYPPQRGGVSDYVESIATKLVAAGDEVHVWAPPLEGAASSIRSAAVPTAGQSVDADGALNLSAVSRTVDNGSLEVHRLSGRFTPGTFPELGAALDRDRSRGPILLVQYVPHVFGMKAMNVPFCAWLASRPERTWVMFHEVAAPWGRDFKFTHNVLGAVTRAMALLVAVRAERIFMSTPAWEPFIRAPRSTPRTWLPIPSNLPEERPAAEDVERKRRELVRREGEKLVGHFGTFGALVTDVLGPALVALLNRNEDVTATLLGRNSQRFADELSSAHGHLRDRIRALGTLGARDIVETLCACDVLLQPFPDGVTTRRTSLMAGLAVGATIVTNREFLTEPFWSETDGVALAPDARPESLVREVEALLGDATRRARLAGSARKLYEARFSTDRVVETLRAPLENH